MPIGYQVEKTTKASKAGRPVLVGSTAVTAREIGTRTGLNLWGNVYPRGGFLHQTDDHKSGAVVAQRAGDIVTRRNQIHVYQPLLANARDGYWPAGAQMETDASTGKWQELTPTLSNSCVVFPHSRTRVQAQQGMGGDCAVQG